MVAVDITSLYLAITIFSLKFQSGDSPLHDASRKGNADVVTILLSEGADIDIRNKVRITIL